MSTETMERDIQQLKDTVADLKADLHCAEQMIEHLMTCTSSAEPLRRIDVRLQPLAKRAEAADVSAVAMHVDGPWQNQGAHSPGE